MKTVKDYPDLYLCGTLLLPDLFENFRNNRLKNYGFCLSHYLSAPSLSWDAVLYITKVEPELIPDPDIFIFFEKATKGEVSYISKIYSKAQNKYLKSCKPKQESKHIIYLDANKLFGYECLSSLQQID